MSIVSKISKSKNEVLLVNNNNLDKITSTMINDVSAPGEDLALLTKNRKVPL